MSPGFSLHQEIDHAERDRLSQVGQDPLFPVREGGADLLLARAGPGEEPLVFSVHRRGDQLVSLEEPKMVVREGDREAESAGQLPQMKPGILADEVVQVLPGLDREDLLVHGDHAALSAAA